MAHSAVAKIAAQADARPSRVLFARIGWMTYYSGPQVGDERPKGGGANNSKNIGHEVFNFADFGGKHYGFVRAKNSRINLARIDPSASNAISLDDVLVIFVARQRIVGWYRHAAVQSVSIPYPSGVEKNLKQRLNKAGVKEFKIERYKFEALKDDAVLLPTRERTHEIPGSVKGGFGQSNVCYLYQNSGKRKPGKWIDDAIFYVLKYDKENLLKNPAAENESDESAIISQEQAAGFQSNAAIRKAIEEYAMSKAKAALTARRYGSFENTSKFKPYDYMCQRGGTAFYVEVKGTQTFGKTLILTSGEVKHVQNKDKACILVLVHSVSVSGMKTIRVSGGTVDVRENWRVQPGDLKPIQYVWTVD